MLLNAVFKDSSGHVPDFVNNMFVVKLLIIRFSSIGDLTQALSIPSFIKSYVPQAEVHFITRSDLAPLLENHPHIHRIWSLDKNLGFSGLIKMISELKSQRFTHVYDAHNNLRSFLIRVCLFKPIKLVRPMKRIKRYLLLNWHINLFEMPFSGQKDLIQPLEKWNFKYFLPDAPQLFLDPKIKADAAALISKYNLTDYIVIAPSASYELKRWPIQYWNKLIQLNPQKQFVVLAGKDDLFTSELNQNTNCINLTGQTNLLLSAALVEKAKFVICNDTGLLHFAEQLNKPAIALMGPAPFGFPSRNLTTILQKDLPCRPCSKHGQGPCTNPNFQECLQSIKPDDVTKILTEKLS